MHAKQMKMMPTPLRPLTSPCPLMVSSKQENIHIHIRTQTQA